MALLAEASLFILTGMSKPTDLSKEQLLELVGQQTKQLAQNKDRIEQLESKLDQKQRDYLKLWQERFGAKSERYMADPDQLKLDFGDTPETEDVAAGIHQANDEAGFRDAELEIPAHKRKQRKKRDASLPAHLPRTEIIHDIDEADKSCPQHGEKTQLPDSMSDRREKLVYVPASCHVEVHVYPKYSCTGCSQCGISSAERPTGIVEGDKYDTSVAAQIITQKYAYHLPLYRQQDMFAGSGWTPGRSTLLNILTGSHYVLEPLLAYFRQTLKSDPIVACDDTGVRMLYPKVPPNLDVTAPKQKRIAEVFDQALKEGKPSINAKMWAYRGVSVKLNLFDFTVSRHRDGPELFFENYQGTLLGDCWHGFGAIATHSHGSIVRAACNAHARRKFEDAKDYPADRHRWMQWFQDLYDLETQGRTMSADQRLKLRQSQSRAIWDLMRVELESIDDRSEQVVLPKSELRKALNYTCNHWTELTRYLDDASLPMDNNECEQLMKQVAIGRKNWLFAGSVAGGERTAGFMTLVSSAHRNDLDVWTYVNDVLKRMLAGQTEYQSLLPWNWAQDHPEAIRKYRQEERRQRDVRKEANRDRRRANKARKAKLKKR